LKGTNIEKFSVRNFNGDSIDERQIKILFSRKDCPKFKYKLSFDENSNRVGFAVGGRNNA